MSIKSRRGFLKIITGLAFLPLLPPTLSLASTEKGSADKKLVMLDGWVLLESDLDSILVK